MKRRIAQSPAYGMRVSDCQRQEFNPGGGALHDAVARPPIPQKKKVFFSPHDLEAIPAVAPISAG